MVDPIRVFIGTSANDEDIEFDAVVDYTLRKHASRELDVHWLRLSRDPSSFWYSDPQKKAGWRTEGWATPFSALRWGIPAYCKFSGKAIYLDLDMLVKADIAELWDTSFNQKPMVSKHQAICVSLMDCAAMGAMLPPVERIKSEVGLYRDIRRVFSRPENIRRYHGNWNTLDMRRDEGGEYASVDDSDIRLLHYTSIPTQPHLRYAIPRLQRENGVKHWYTKGAVMPHPRKDAVELFDRTLEEAIAARPLDSYRNATKFGDYGR